MASEFFRPTEGQLIRDRAFLGTVWRDLVVPLVEELSESIPGYATMPWQDRAVMVVELNEPFAEKGDWLMLGEMPVFAGCRLGEIRTDFVQDAATGEISHKVERYVQRFSNDYLGALHSVRGSISYFINGERETYDQLPVSYRVALVALYVLQNVNVAPDEASAFALGVDGVSFEPRRFTAFHTFDQEGRCSGWLVRLRDSKPPQRLAIKLASFLRDTADDESRSFDFEIHKGKRRTNERSERAFEYVENLIRQGVVIGRGGSMTWDEVAGQLSKEYGDDVRAYTGDNLRDCYRKYKQRTEGR